MEQCEVCGREVSEDQVVRKEKDGKVMSVCKGCATGMKGFA